MTQLPRRFAGVVLGITMLVAPVSGENAPPGQSLTPLQECICAAIAQHLMPKKTGGRTQYGSNGDVDRKAFADAIRKCLSDHGTTSVPVGQGNFNVLIGGQVFSVYIVAFQGQRAGAEATSASDIVIAISGDTGDSTQSGLAARATARTGGGAVAIGGAGGNNDKSPGDGGAGTAVSQGGGDTVAGGGAGGIGLNSGGTGGPATATSGSTDPQHTTSTASTRATARGGAGGDPKNNGATGGSGGGATAGTDVHGTTTTPGVGPNAPGPGEHGTGAVAGSGRGLNPPTSGFPGQPTPNQ